MEAFVRTLWSLLSGDQRSGLAYDNLVSQALRFLSTAIRSGNYRGIFENRETINGLVEGVVVPNVSLRTHEVEQFEDDPLEYVRLDLSFASASSAAVAGGLTAEGTTRRQAAADVLRALVASGFEAITTEIVLRWVGLGLQEYSANPRGEDTWKQKDRSVFLLTAVATLGATAQVRLGSLSSTAKSPIIAQQGVTSTNALVDVVDFFSRGMYFRTYELMLMRSPILQVDSICFLYSFRNQVSLLLLPLLFGVLYRCSQHSSRKNSSFLSFHFFYDVFMYATHMLRRLSDGSSLLNTTLCYHEQQHALQHFPANCLPSFNQEDICKIRCCTF